MARFTTYRERERLRRQNIRRVAFDDGFAGRPARSTLAEYQLSYRRGQETRRGTVTEGPGVA